MPEKKSDSWFRIRFTDGREVEIHAPNAIEIYERDFKSTNQFSAFQDNATQSETLDPVTHTSSGTDVFSGHLEKVTGTSDAILKILETPWGKAKLRTWNEIMNGLQVAGHQFSEGAITGALPALVKQGKVRRMKIGKSYEYGLQFAGK